MIPRSEYPRPQFIRKDWANLNGTWEFETDLSLSKMERKNYEKEKFEGEILVPFCPESKLSGIGNTDFLNGVWYKRDFTIDKSWQNKRILLHFGAVDYETTVFINQKKAGTHKGGYSSFSFDITDYLDENKNTVVVFAKDDNRSCLQPSGKQSRFYYSCGCDYTRTTGIWQTVWLEPVDEDYIKSVKFYPDIDNCAVTASFITSKARSGLSIETTVSFNGKEVGFNKSEAKTGTLEITVNLSEKHLWDVGQGNLYDVNLKLFKDGVLKDEVKSYFGLRSVSIQGKKVLINHRPIFQRLVLDQGFYEDGIYTAPTDADLEKDILLSLDMGFNGARLHQKIFEPRFLYYADKHGYLVWSEHANWGLNHSEYPSLYAFLPEWIEGIERDFNHPSIIGYCPFNETWNVPNGKTQINELLEITYKTTKALDPTRPVIDTSGNFHTSQTDIYDIHDYEQDAFKFAAKFEDMKHGGKAFNNFENRQQYGGQPYFVSEYGGIKWDEENKNEGWGYGEAPKTKEELVERYAGLTKTLLDNPYIFGFCYTQLYDVEQEVNGLYTYRRIPKFDPEVIKKINQQKAAIEE